ncbi:unnamed protein product, partial [Mesorhabditis spiculigera]
MAFLQIHTGHFAIALQCKDLRGQLRELYIVGVKVNWEDPNPERAEENRLDGNGRHYIVQYGLYQSERHEKIRANTRHMKLVNLLPGREYEVAVKVIDGNGRESPWSIRDIILTPKGAQF